MHIAQRGRLVCAFDATYMLQTMTQHADAKNQFTLVGGAWHPEHPGSASLDLKAESKRVRKASEMFLVGSHDMC